MIKKNFDALHKNGIKRDQEINDLKTKLKSSEDRANSAEEQAKLAETQANTHKSKAAVDATTIKDLLKKLDERIKQVREFEEGQSAKRKKMDSLLNKESKVFYGQDWLKPKQTEEPKQKQKRF